MTLPLQVPSDSPTEETFSLPTYSRLLHLLNNPFYPSLLTPDPPLSLFLSLSLEELRHSLLPYTTFRDTDLFCTLHKVLDFLPVPPSFTILSIIGFYN